MDSEYRIVLSLSTAPQTLSVADELLALAASNPSEAAVLSACVVITVAAALSQALQSALQTKAQDVAAEQNQPARETEAYRLFQEGTFRHQMLDLPRVISDGAFGLRRQAPAVSLLHDMITLRNALVHIEEPPYVLSEVSAQVSRVGDDMVIRVPSPKSPWFSVTLEEAQKYRDAVHKYLNDVLCAEDFRDSDLLEPV